jgi:hypothetical protein
VPSQERSAVSLEKEIMRLQEVLRERETEISVLEESLKVQTIAPPDEDKEPIGVVGTSMLRSTCSYH